MSYPDRTWEQRFSVKIYVSLNSDRWALIVGKNDFL